MKCAVIVDPFSTGRFLAQEFKRRGIQPIAVLTDAPDRHYAGASFAPEDFLKHVVDDGDQESLLEQLRRHDVLCVVPGCESGVLLADVLCDALHIFSNDPALSLSRRDKFEMQERIRNYGLRSIRQGRFSKVEQAVAWMRSEKLQRVVAKPLRSGGSDNVWMCATEADLRTHFQDILGARTVLGESNAEVLVQEFIEGVEFVVDAISFEGEVLVTNACRYVKEAETGAFVYRQVHVLPADDPQIASMLDYHAAVLRALGVRFGATHTEIMLSHDGPVLVECGARLHGGSTVPQLVGTCSGQTPIELLVEAYAEPPSFRQRVQDGVRFTRHAAVYVLANPHPGTVQSVSGVARIRGLRSFNGVQLNVKPGQAVQRTRDLYTAPAWVSLCAENQDAVVEDIARIAAWERSGEIIPVLRTLAPANVSN